jgi:hypothetical protein
MKEMSGSVIETQTGHESLPRAVHHVLLVGYRHPLGYELQSRCPYDHRIQHRDLFERPNDRWRGWRLGNIRVRANVLDAAIDLFLHHLEEIAIYLYRLET